MSDFNPSDPLPPPQASGADRRGRWVAIVTGAISVLVGVLYLLMIVLLDSRGPLQPPPPEALGLVSASAPAVAPDRRQVVVAVPVPSAAGAPQPG